MISRARVATTLAAVSLAVATLVACQGGGEPPEFDPVQDQIAQVGVELSLALVATDPDGGDIDFSFSSTIPDIQTRASLTRNPSGAGIWRWTPLAADVGVWYVDFVATDGDNEATITVTIDVRSAIGGNSAPVFRQPLGTGTTLDLEQDDCLEVALLVEDQDSTSVVLAQEEPLIEGATITSTGGLSGTWTWCPSETQIAADDRYNLRLSADDLQNPKVLKDYLVVLRGGNRPECPGEPPVIAHTPADATTINNLTIDAAVSDDQGLKAAPLFYYALTDPGADPDLGAMTQLTMVQLDGTMQSGTWAADVPNPVVGMPDGTARTIYYVIVADDDDDEMGTCDHTTESTVYEMTVTAGGGGTVELCEPCTASSQCADGLCVRVGVMNEPYCLQDCAGPADCGAGYTCSAAAVSSVDGQSARQCVPDTESCTGGGGCVDDAFEDNDTRTQAADAPPLPAGDIYELTSCPLTSGTGDDEDWFELDIPADRQVTLEIAGEATTDLDLGLYSSTGAVIVSSTSLDSDETITRCLTPGLYYARVYAFGEGQNDYLLSYDAVAQSCASACNDDAVDAGAQDDNLAQARTTVYPVHTATAQTICTDDDWYAVDLFDGERVIVDLTFNQANATQDLDLHFHNAAGTDLTPCSEAAPSTCTTAQGQSATSNEHYEFTAPASGCGAGCAYYVVVHGWAGSKNTYDIRIEVE